MKNFIFLHYLGYSVIALLWYTILWLKYISYISVNKWLREGSMSNPPPVSSQNDDDDDRESRLFFSLQLDFIDKTIFSKECHR